MISNKRENLFTYRYDMRSLFLFKFIIILEDIYFLE